MRRTLAILALALSLSFFLSAEQGHEKEIEDFFNKWKHFVEELDISGVMELYAKDYLQSGMTRSVHRLLYRAMFALIRDKKGSLRIEPEIRNLKFWSSEGREKKIFADLDLVVLKEEIFGDTRYLDRVLYPVRLRKEKGNWKLCGDKTRTLCVLQVGFDGKDYFLTLIAESAFPEFPATATVEGPGIGTIQLRKLRKDIMGKPYVTETVYTSNIPQVGDTYTFRIPYQDGEELIRLKVRALISQPPAIITPEQDADINKWPLKISWEDVSKQITDFNCYEVHIRKAEDHSLVYLFRSIPPGTTSVPLGATEKQQKFFTEPHIPYYIEVFAYDIYGNYSISRRRVYYMIGAEKE